MGISSREGVLLGANLGRAIVTNGDLTAYVCDSASTVEAAVCDGASSRPRHCCITWRSTSCKEKERFWEFLFPIFIMENAIKSPTVKCFRCVYENLTTFPFGKCILERSIRGLFGDIFGFKINVGVYEKFAKK